MDGIIVSRDRPFGLQLGLDPLRITGPYHYENRLYSQPSIARRTSTGFSVMGQ